MGKEYFENLMNFSDDKEDGLKFPQRGSWRSEDEDVREEEGLKPLK